MVTSVGCARMGTLTLPCAVSRLPGLQRLSHGGKEVGRLTGDDMPSP